MIQDHPPRKEGNCERLGMGTPSNAILEVESELVQRMIFQTLPLERRRGDRREYHWDQLRARHAQAVDELGGHSPLTSTAHDFACQGRSAARKLDLPANHVDHEAGRPDANAGASTGEHTCGEDGAVPASHSAAAWQTCRSPTASDTYRGWVQLSSLEKVPAAEQPFFTADSMAFGSWAVQSKRTRTDSPRIRRGSAIFVSPSPRRAGAANRQQGPSRPPSNSNPEAGGSACLTANSIHGV